MSGTGGLLTFQPPQVLDDLRRLFLRPEGVCFVGVPGGQQSGGRTGWLPTFPVFESLKVVVDVGLLAQVHREGFYHRDFTLITTRRVAESPRKNLAAGAGEGQDTWSAA